MLTTKDAQALRFELMAREYVQRIGTRLREHREALGLSQKEVADQLPPPVDGNYISRWERGQHKPSDERLEDLAAILQTTVAELLTDPPDKSQTPDLPFEDADLMRLKAELAAMRVELGGVRTALEDLRRMLARSLKTQARQRQSRQAK